VKPVVTPAEMAEADRRAIAAGTPESVLVARAGRAVARHARRMLGGTYGRRVVVVAGKGNNGADGRVAARLLRALGVGVDCFDLPAGIEPAALARAVHRADLAIDAMFGTGFRGTLTDDAAHVAQTLRDAALPTLAVDIPSGVDGAAGSARGDAVRARETICFAALKPGLLFEPGRERAGTVHVADIGLDPGPTQLHVLEADDVFVPRRPAEAHKWSAAALIVGGSTGMTGAPIMASHAASRCGAAMVVCALPGQDAAARASAAGAIVTRALPATAHGALGSEAASVLLKDVERFRVVAIGPGLGRDEGTQAAVRQVVAECPVPIVVDADALNALAVDLVPLRQRSRAGFPEAILTPHAGEYARLAGTQIGDDRVAAARELASRTGAIVVLKGPGTVIAAPGGDAVVNRTDNPALATAGTGDVLTGIIAGFVANGATPFDGAASGAYVHGRAGAAAGSGPDLVATDLLGALHPTLAELRSGPGDEEE
jgi:NAD(P)H-hydrate epimerase